MSGCLQRNRESGSGKGGERKEISPAARLRRLPEDNGPLSFFFSLFKTHPVV